MRSRLPLLLAAIFAAFHLIVVGGALESGSGGEGLAVVILAYDFLLLALCQHAHTLGGYLCYGVSHGSFAVLLISGTVMYGLAGFVIGVVIRLRALATRR
jgi:hypothetical protein